MALTNTNVSVLATNPTTPGTTLILGAHRGSINDPTPVTIYNPGTSAVFVGGPSVTVGNGVPIAAGSSASFTLAGGDYIYGVSSTTTTVNVMQGRN